MLFISKQLDLALLIGKPCFREALHEMVSLYAPVPQRAPENVGKKDFFPRMELETLPELSQNNVPRWESVSFAKFSATNIPFIIPGAISNWPALNMPHRMWRTDFYLRSVIGHRTVPVEVGKTYLSDFWRVELMLGAAFLDDYLLNPNPDKVGYLAQYKVLDHITELTDDLAIPDLALSRADEEEIQINLWLGPSGTITPCHHDPYDNLLCQVFGSKYVRLYAPSEAGKLYPSEKKSTSNTSLVDVESPDYGEFPLYKDAEYQDCILREGDMLYIPKGWWHFVKSLETSCSVSFWWDPSS